LFSGALTQAAANNASLSPDHIEFIDDVGNSDAPNSLTSYTDAALPGKKFFVLLSHCIDSLDSIIPFYIRWFT
jgi:hypothetical protein